MSKQILLFLLSCVLLPPASLVAQYTTAFSPNTTDATSYATSGTNTWYLLGGAGLCKELSLAQGGTLWCIGTDNGVYSFNNLTHAWVSYPSMGYVTMDLAVRDTSNIYRLAESGCGVQGLGYGVWKWSGSTWTAKNGCLSQFQVGTDGTIVGVNAVGQILKSSDDGSTWTQLAATSGWAYASVSDASTVCAVNAGKLYTLVSGVMTLYSLQPSGTQKACIITSLDSVLISVDTTNVARLHNASTWQAITGQIVKGVAIDKGHIFALGGNGYQIYHWNVYASYLYGVVQGSYNNCPIPGDPCPNGVTHTGTIKITYPHSLHGNLGTWTGAPTSNMNASSWDADSQCDLFFGDPSAPECQPATSGSAVCNSSGGTFTNVPPAPKYETAHSRVVVLSSHCGGTGEPKCSSGQMKYTVSNHCDDISPDLNPGGSAVNYLWYDAGLSYFDVEAPCWSLNGHAPWHCISFPRYGLAVNKGYSTDPGTATDCTVTP